MDFREIKIQLGMELIIPNQGLEENLKEWLGMDFREIKIHHYLELESLIRAVELGLLGTGMGIALGNPMSGL